MGVKTLWQNNLKSKYVLEKVKMKKQIKIQEQSQYERDLKGLNGKIRLCG